SRLVRSGDPASGTTYSLPYPTLFRSIEDVTAADVGRKRPSRLSPALYVLRRVLRRRLDRFDHVQQHAPGQRTDEVPLAPRLVPRPEEHTSELQSREKIVRRLLIEQKK